MPELSLGWFFSNLHVDVPTLPTIDYSSDEQSNGPVSPLGYKNPHDIVRGTTPGSQSWIGTYVCKLSGSHCMFLLAAVRYHARAIINGMIPH